MWPAAKAFQVAWWMQHYGHESPKRSKGWRNSKSILSLNKGLLRRGRMKKNKPLAVHYKNSNGEKKWPLAFGKALRDLLPCLLSDMRGKPDGPAGGFNGPSFIDSLQVWTFKEDWPEAKLCDCVHYLRGTTLLDLPLPWKLAFPKRL